MDSFSALYDLIGDLARRRFVLAERHFATLGFNHTEARLLNLLAQAGGTAAQESLSSQMHIDRTNVGRALKSLEARGLIERQADAADKRGKQVVMTEGGRAAVGTIRALKDRMVADYFGALEAADAQAAFAALKKILPAG